MSIVDGIIGFFSPRAAYEREVWKQAREVARSYDAGINDRLNSGWRAQNQSGLLEDQFQRDTLRARARDLERNSDIMGSVLTSFERNIIGPGFRLQAKTGDEALNDRIEALWLEWCKARNCDVTGVQSFPEICRMALRRKKVDGGFLLLKRYEHGRRVPFCLQCLDVDELDAYQNISRHKDNRVVDGVEVNAHGKHAGYWIRQYALDGMTQNPAVYVDVKDIIFYWSRRRPSQIREVSELASTLTRIRDINSFMEAVSVKERIAACFGIAIKRQNPLPVNGRGVAGRFNTGTKEGSYDKKSITPGMIMELEPGDEVQPVQPAAQGGSAADFVRLQQRLVGAGMGLGYETVSRDMSQVNYSSARQGLIEDGLTYAIERQSFTEHVLDEIYETFVISCVVSGALPIPGFWEKKQEYLHHVWTPPAKPWIDPLKEAQANRVALASGLKTFQQIAAENGRDWREQIDEIAAAITYAEEMNVKIGGMIDEGKQPLPPVSGGRDPKGGG